VSYFATGPVTAAQLEAIVCRIVVKGADEPVTSTTTLQNDDALTITVAANTIYRAKLMLVYDGLAAADFKYSLSGPTGTTYPAWKTYGLDTADAAVIGSVYRGLGAFPALHGALGVGTSLLIDGGGIVNVGANPGSVTVQWAQITSNATATSVKAGSFFELQQVVSF
jgi:hypothetical protein